MPDTGNSEVQYYRIKDHDQDHYGKYLLKKVTLNEDGSIPSVFECCLKYPKSFYNKNLESDEVPLINHQTQDWPILLNSRKLKIFLFL